MSDEVPDFIIIGAQKAATSFIQLCLNSHPDVTMPSGEVPFFEDPDYDPSQIDRFKSWLRRLKASNALKVGIKRADYLASSECPERIYRHSPNVRLIVILREPLQRFKSAYYHYIRSGFIPALDINLGARKILSGEWKDEYPISNKLLEYGLYYKHLSQYLEYFDYDQVHIVCFDEIKENPVKVTRGLYEFVDVDSEYIPNDEIYKKPKKYPYNLKILSLIRIANILIHDYYDNNKRAKKKPIYKCPIRYIISYTILALSNIFSELFVNDQKSQIDKCVKKEIREIYREDVVSLKESELINVSHWYY